MEHVTDDVLSVLAGLLPGHLDGGGGQRLGVHPGRHARQAVGPEDREAGAGLHGAGTVLHNALVDGLVVLADAVYGQGAGGGTGRDKNGKKNKEFCPLKAILPHAELN